MKRLITYGLLVLITVSIAKAQECRALLTIESDSTALIFINSKFAGKGKVDVEIEKGLHKVVVKNSLYQWNANEIERSIEIGECGKKYEFDFVLSKKVFIDSTPQDAAIIKNNSLVGHTPNFIELKSSDKLELRKGSSVTELSKNLLGSNSPIPIDFEKNNKPVSFSDSPIFKVLLGSAVILGATAAYFKLQADNKYDDYLRSKDRSILDQVDKLDLYSGISFGLLQVNFGYLIYRFLTD